MKFLCDGSTVDVRELFLGIPDNDDRFTNSESFYFEMFHHNVYYKKE